MSEIGGEITDLREYFTHVNYVDEDREVTRCSLIAQDERVIAQGIAICCPQDQYSRKRGNMIARARAYKALRTMKCSNPVSPKMRGYLHPTYDLFKVNFCDYVEA